MSSLVLLLLLLSGVVLDEGESTVLDNTWRGGQRLHVTFRGERRDVLSAQWSGGDQPYLLSRRYPKTVSHQHIEDRQPRHRENLSCHSLRII